MFQKPFVELFVNESVVKDIEHRAKAADGLVTFYAGNKKVSGTDEPKLKKGT